MIAIDILMMILSFCELIVSGEILKPLTRQYHGEDTKIKALFADNSKFSS